MTSHSLWSLDYFSLRQIGDFIFSFITEAMCPEKKKKVQKISQPGFEQIQPVRPVCVRQKYLF